MSKEMAEAQQRDAVFITVGKVAAAAWVGYAIYALRAGSLLGSFLSIMPLWRSLDPLPVIEAAEARLHRAKRKLKSGKDEQDLRSVVG
jgi:hypothetical protein